MKNKISLPWGAWYGDDLLELSVPESWDIVQFSLPNNKRISTSEIGQKLIPLNNELLAKKPKSIVIVVDDLTRPVILEELLSKLLKNLDKIGYRPDNVKILVGLGSHKGLDKPALVKKLGQFTVEHYSCINHHPDDTIAVDLIWGKTPLKLNRHYMEADYKIVISGLTPHSFAGFSGGAKMLFPGLADMETIAKTHKSVLMGFMGKLGDIQNNKFRSTIEKFVEHVGLDFFIGVIINADRSIRNIYCGNFVEAHRKAATEAREYYLTNISQYRKPFDAVILNAYPKDTELLQAENAFIPLKSSKTGFLKEGASIVLTSACSEGLGHHGLFGPGGVLYRKPRPLRFLKGHPFTFFSQNITADEFHELFVPEYHLVTKKETLVNRLEKELPPEARVAVFPHASLQLMDC